MLPTRLQSLQLELHIHHRWLSGFLQRTQASSFSTTVPRYASVKYHGRPAAPEKNVYRSVKDPSPKRESRNQKYKDKIKKKFEKSAEPEATPTNPIIEDIREKAAAARVTHVIENYNALNDQDKGTLERTDVRQIAQCLHYSVRKEKHNAAIHHRQSTLPEFVEFAETLVRDLKKEVIIPNGRALVHLIGVFKESGSRDKGVQFWQWLVQQDETYIDVDCYGAAIELLAVNGTPLPELESLYQEALRRFPGNFAAYHLSPDAILPDRELPFTVGGVPISLLQGILTARLLSADTRNAYLALDTAMRILPDQVPQRLFWLFLEERPLQEAYAIFALACRGGNAITGGYYRSMLAALRIHLAPRSPAQSALAVRAMLSVTHMYIANGGAVAANNVNELVIAATQFLRVRGVDALGSKEKQKIVDSVMEAIRGIFEVFGRYGAKPGIPAFNSIITNLGGFGHSKKTIGIALKDADALGLAPTDVTWRSIMSVGGMFQDRSLVEKTWGHLRDSRIEAEENPRASDFHALVKPAHLSGAVEFALEELEKFRHVLEAHAYEEIATRLEDPMEAETSSGENVEPVDVAYVLAEIDKVKADIENIKERTEGSPTVQDLSEQALPITLLPLSSDLDLPDAQLREIYDEFTSTASTQTTPAQDPDAFDAVQPAAPTPAPAQPTSATPAKSKTNIPFSTLRFQNWKTINLLLKLSEQTDLAYTEKVDKAMAAGLAPPRRTRGLVGVGNAVEQGSWGLSSVKEKPSGGEEGGEVSAEEVASVASVASVARVREKIVRLRGRGGGV